MWYLASWEKGFKICWKNGNVFKKPIICFTERRGLLWGRQSVFSTFLWKCFYSCRSMDVVGQPGHRLQSPTVNDLRVKRNNGSCHSLAQTEAYFTELKKAWLVSSEIPLGGTQWKTGVNGYELQEGKFFMENHQHSGARKVVVLARHFLWLLKSHLR